MPIVNISTGRAIMGAAGGAVEFGNIAPNLPYGDTAITSVTCPVTVLPGACYLLAFVGNYSSSSTGTPDSVTYKGLNLTRLARSIRASGAYPAAEVWYLANPPVSFLDSVDITMPGNTNVIACACAVYGSADTLGAVTGASSGLVSAADTALLCSPPVVIDVLVKHYKEDGLACASGQDLRRLVATERSTANLNIEMAVSVGYDRAMMSWAWSNTRNYAHVCVTF